MVDYRINIGNFKAKLVSGRVQDFCFSLCWPVGHLIEKEPVILLLIDIVIFYVLYELLHRKTNNLHMRKQRRRSAVQ